MLRTASDGRQTVTDGPYAEASSSSTGFYVVDTSDIDDLLEVCKVLGEGEGVIEVREMTGGHLVMKFLVLMAEEDSWNRWNALSDSEQQAAYDRFTAFTKAVEKRG